MLRFSWSIVLVGAIFVIAPTLIQGLSSVAELRAKWEGVSNGVGQINEQAKAESNPSATISEKPSLEQPPVSDKSTSSSPSGLQLTPTLVAWVSSQSEGIVEEMEAIAQHNAKTDKFSVISYLRYLKLYDSLKVIARQPIAELKWVNRKAKVFASVYDAATLIVMNYLADLDAQLTKVELAEPKGKQVEVSKKWVELYESIKYIATHASKGSRLAETATMMLKSSPTNTSDKMRSTRYQLKTHAFNR